MTSSRAVPAVFGFISLVALVVAAVIALAASMASAGGGTIVVNSQLDTDTAANRTACENGDPLCTLRAAVSVANLTSGATIMVDPGPYALTILNAGNEEDANATGDLDILSSMSIIGAGDGVTTIDATLVSDRHFDIVCTGCNVLLEAMLLQNGLASGDVSTGGCFPEFPACGGSIWNNGNLTIRGSTLTNNSAPQCCGGAIFDNEATLLIEDSHIDGNDVDNCCGGGIWGWEPATSSGGPGSQITVRNSTVNNNTAVDCCGGGIVVFTGSLTVEDSQVNGNEADDCCGGGIWVDEGPLTIRNSTVNGNSTAQSCCGGGIYHTGDSVVPVLNITDSEVNNNNGGPTCCGGGIYLEGGGQRRLQDQGQPSLPSGAGLSGPASAAARALSPSGATAPSGFNGVGTATILRSSVSGNTVGNCCGGGIFNEGAEMTITDSTIEDNSITGVANCCGGGIDNGEGTLILEGTIVRNNTSGSLGAGIYNSNGSLFAAGSYIIGNIGDDGIHVAFGGTDPVARDGIICGNEEAGVYLSVDTTFDAVGNWWGAPTGPFHDTRNTGGDGDEVVDGTTAVAPPLENLESPPTGFVEFEPWIDTVTGSSAGGAVAGTPITVSFQFSGGDGAVFLGLGAGNPNEPAPYTVTTENGELESSQNSGPAVTEFINGAQGTLSVMLTPAAEGEATVNVEGPCGLEGELTIEVEEQVVFEPPDVDVDPDLSPPDVDLELPSPSVTDGGAPVDGDGAGPVVSTGDGSLGEGTSLGVALAVTGAAAALICLLALRLRSARR